MSGKTLGQVAYEGFVASQEPDGFEYETWADKDEHGDSATMGRADINVVVTLSTGGHW